MGFTTTKFFPQAVSPTAYQIGQYGRTPVSYFHGLPQISVPLTEVRGRGFTLPVSLSYHGGGIKPDQHPGWVGLGWSLHAGGSITRVIHGMKDEMSISEYNHLHQESNTDEHPGYLYHIHEIQNDSAWNSTEVADRLYTGKKDYSPDEYIVNAPGISASFVIVGEHELRAISRDESAISLEGYDVVAAGENSIDMYEEGPDNSAIPAKRYAYIRRIILRDKEGNRYIFGGTEESIEYSVIQYQNNDYANGTVIVNTKRWDAVATANTWMLTRLERADGEVFEFTYERHGVPIVMRDVHQGCAYATDSGEDRFMVPVLDVPGYSTDTYRDEHENGCKSNLSYHFLMPCYLVQVKSILMGDRLDFDIARTTELIYDEGRPDYWRDFEVYCAYQPREEPFHMPLSGFQDNDYYCKLIRIHGSHRDIRFIYTDDEMADASTTRLKLLEIHVQHDCIGEMSDETDSVWRFDYDGTSLPAYNSFQTDIWGYYNGRSYASRRGSFGRGLSEYRSGYDDADIHAACQKAETLTCVHYPTGGRTDYDWEPHRYGKRVLPPDFLVEETGEMTAGGLRIRSITDHASDGNTYSRLFSYAQGGVSSGVLCSHGECLVEGNHSIHNRHYNIDGQFVMYSELPILPLSDTDGSHVTYSKVRETFADNSYSEYSYSNHGDDGCNDEMPAIYLGRADGCPLYPQITSNALLRGLLRTMSMHRSDGTVVREEAMAYYGAGLTCASAVKDLYCGKRVAFLTYSRIRCGYPALRSRTILELCDDGSYVTDRYEYAYNDDRLLISETHLRDDGPLDRMSEETRLFYPNERTGIDIDDMRREGFTGLVLGIVKMRDGMVTDAQEAVYKKMFIPAEESGRTDRLDGGTHARPTWRPCKSYSSKIEVPVTLEQYSAAPMSYMQASPDVEVKIFDETAAPLFAGMKDGSAAELSMSARHGAPAMVTRASDRSFTSGTSSVYHQIRMAMPEIVTEEFNTTDPSSTFTCNLYADFGYAFHVIAVLDGVSHHLVQWCRSEMPDERWTSLMDMYQNCLSLAIGAGHHTLSVRHVEWLGESSQSQTVGGSVYVMHGLPATYSPESFFVDLDVENESGVGFHCGHGHAGPLTVNRNIPSGSAYVLDYMERQADGEWHYMRTAYSGGNVTIGGTGRTVSNVRIYPEGSMPESYSYRDFVGMTAKTDARGVSESYGYDGLGRLSEVHDNDGILGREHSYLFATAGGGTGTDNSVRTTEYNYASTGDAIAKTTVSHLDGLGRPVQETLVGGGGDGGDIITRKEYDIVGRELRNLVPTPSDADDNDFSDDARWTENVYEASPRDRILSVIGPGQVWRDADKKVTTLLYANSTTVPELMHRGFRVTDSDGNPLTVGRRLLRSPGLTSDGLLNVTKTISEDDEFTLVFSNVHGEEVLTRRILTDDVTGEVTYADTHTVRDAFGRVAAVIPPKLTAQLESSDASQWDYSEIEDLAFLYRYDGRGNRIAKNIPGGGWTYMAYDKGGRCVFTQDAVQREQGRWAFRLVDLLGRECVTGTVVRDMGFQSDPIASTNIYVSLPSSPDYSGTLKGYALSGLSSLGTDPRILTVSYYDGYGFNAGDSTLTYSAPSSSETYGRQSLLTATGLLTGRLVRVLDVASSETFLKDVLYYDDKGRVIQKCSTNIFGKVDREYIAYDFAGNVTKRKVVHGKPGTTSTFTETLTFTFDAMGRPLKTTHKAGTATSRMVNNRIYDSVGRLSSLSRINPPVAALTQTYSYNIRSWLTAIGGTLFREEIDYCTGNDPRWDGKISGIRWKNPSETAWRSFRYGYDSLSRLVSADYAGAETDMICSEEYDYDLNCNLLHRMSSAPGMFMPTLEERTYEGNRLEEDLTNGVSYDACGRYTGSSGSVVSTSYNEIGLPLEMTLSDGSMVRTVYAADGRKLRETTVLSGTSATRSYSGSCIFEGNTLKKVLFEGGYAQMSGSTPSYMFFLTDHLGSVRVVAAQNADVKQVNQYYPFGDLIADSHVTAGTSDNRYRFIGKEFGERTGLYDFSARYLEPSMGRFTTIDPLAEKYPSISPYVYCAGDPVNRVDRDGREGIKYYDQDGKKIIESNIVVLINSPVDIPENASAKQRMRLERRNERTLSMNSKRLEDAKRILDSVYNGTIGGSKNSKGEIVSFIFNVIGIESKTLSPDSSTLSRMAKENGLPASLFGQMTIARAPIVTNSSTNGALGLYKGNSISLSPEAPVVGLAHEVGHSLGLIDVFPNGDGIMNYPPAPYLTPEDVDSIWEHAFNRR